MIPDFHYILHDATLDISITNSPVDINTPSCSVRSDLQLPDLA
jgi:hypothetical protein